MTQTHGTRQLGGLVLVLLGGMWGITVLFGLFLMFDYQTTPGAAGNPSARWPADSHLVPTRNGIQLVMVAHPRCPCTRSSIAALARIMALSQDRVTASVQFLTPVNVSSGWEQTDLWRSAAAIPGVRVISDLDGSEAARFGMETSGHVLLYGESGLRIFSGGVTPGRGHCGDNAGLDQCLALIHGELKESGAAPVFGCSLNDRSFTKLERGNLCNSLN